MNEEHAQHEEWDGDDEADGNCLEESEATHVVRLELASETRWWAAMGRGHRLLFFGVEATLHLVEVVAEGAVLLLVANIEVRQRLSIFHGSAITEDRGFDFAIVTGGHGIARVLVEGRVALVNLYASVDEVGKELLNLIILLKASAVLTLVILLAVVTALAILMVLLLSVVLVLELGLSVIVELAHLDEGLLLMNVMVLHHSAGNEVNGGDRAQSHDDEQAASTSGLAGNAPRDA